MLQVEAAPLPADQKAATDVSAVGASQAETAPSSMAVAASGGTQDAEAETTNEGVAVRTETEAVEDVQQTKETKVLMF